jgi:hypothetical protein
VGFESRYIPEKDLDITVISNRSDGEEKVRKTVYDSLVELL